MKTVYLTKEETDALLRPQTGPDWQRMALAMADLIDAAWAELPDDLRATRGEQGSSLAGAIHALRLRAER